MSLHAVQKILAPGKGTSNLLSCCRCPISKTHLFFAVHTGLTFQKGWSSNVHLNSPILAFLAGDHCTLCYQSVISGVTWGGGGGGRQEVFLT